MTITLDAWDLIIQDPPLAFAPAPLCTGTSLPWRRLVQTFYVRTTQWVLPAGSFWRAGRAHPTRIHPYCTVLLNLIFPSFNFV